MLSLVDHSAERNHYIARGFEQAKKFSWDKTAAQTMVVYQSILS
jgi:hypothetical protein